MHNYYYCISDMKFPVKVLRSSIRSYSPPVSIYDMNVLTFYLKSLYCKSMQLKNVDVITDILH